MGPIPMSLTNISALQVLWVLNLKICTSFNFYYLYAILTNIYLILLIKFRDLSNNQLLGVVPDNGSFSLFTPIRFLLNSLIFFHSLVLLINLFWIGIVSACSFANNLNLCGPVTGHPCPGSPPFSPPPPFVPPPPISAPGNLLSAAITPFNY
jgi:somatic embryogenesis receptor kinase 1